MSENKKSKNFLEGKGGNNKQLVIIGVVIIVLLIALIVILLLNKRDSTPEEVTVDGARSVIVSQENADALAEEMSSRESVKPGYYTVAMTSGWHFENSSSASYDAYVKNKAENSNDVYFDLFLEDDKDNPIYESPVISLGAELNQITLNRDLPKGEYRCIMIYHLVDENQETVDTLQVVQTVIIEN